MKKTLGQIAHDAGEKAGGWQRRWANIAESQRAEWETLAQAVAVEVRAECVASMMLTPSDIRLMAGEMTAQEMRTVQAVLNGLAAKIRGS